MAVMFNGLTTITGFGSLLVAHHRGVWSLGVLLVIGSVMTLTASLVLLPTLMRLRDERMRRPAAEPEPVLAIVGRRADTNGSGAPDSHGLPPRVPHRTR
jgi:hypothetical protein